MKRRYEKFNLGSRRRRQQHRHLLYRRDLETTLRVLRPTQAPAQRAYGDSVESDAMCPSPPSIRGSLVTLKARVLQDTITHCREAEYIAATRSPRRSHLVSARIDSRDLPIHLRQHQALHSLTQSQSHRSQQIIHPLDWPQTMSQSGAGMNLRNRS